MGLLKRMRAAIRPDVRQAIDGFGVVFAITLFFAYSILPTTASRIETGSLTRSAGGIRTIEFSIRKSEVRRLARAAATQHGGRVEAELKVRTGPSDLPCPYPERTQFLRDVAAKRRLGGPDFIGPNRCCYHVRHQGPRSDSVSRRPIICFIAPQPFRAMLMNDYRYSGAKCRAANELLFSCTTETEALKALF